MSNASILVGTSQATSQAAQRNKLEYLLIADEENMSDIRKAQCRPGLAVIGNGLPASAANGRSLRLFRATVIVLIDMIYKPAKVSDLLLEFLPNLRRFAISLCRSRDVADDLVQAACERALAHEDRFEPGTRFDAWMFRILRNIWIDRLRKQRTAGPMEDISARLDLMGEDGVRAIEAKSELSAVAAAIDQLSDEQREVLLLVCVEEFSYADTAELLGIPIGTVMSRLARARVNLAEKAGIKPAPLRSSAFKGNHDGWN